MKIRVLVCLLLLILGVHNEALQLFSVSSSSTAVINPSGSVRGGTIIYIKGLGFSASANNNQIFVGPYPCIIPADGATETTLACETSDTNQGNDIYNLPINVISNGQQQSLSNEQGCFSYLNSVTPLISDLYPASAIAGSYINFYGVHRITNLGNGQRDMGDVVSMLIGDTQSGRFDIVQGPIQPNGYDTISCTQALVQEAGKYTVKEHLTPGYSTPSFLLRRSSLMKQIYHYAVLPSVSNLTPHFGSVAGQQLTISGTGFSTNSSKISVSVDGNNCDVVASTSNSIKCNLGQQDTNKTSKLDTNATTQVNGYFSGAGLQYKRYDISKLGSTSLSSFRNAYISSSPSITLVEQGYRGQIKTGSYFGTYYGEIFSGYFTPPVSGQYIFRGVAKDYFAVYLSNQAYGTISASATPLIYSNSWQNVNNFYASYIPTAEGKITLQGGKSYYIQAFHVNVAGTGVFKVSTEVPIDATGLTWQTHAVHKLDLTFTNDPQIIEFNQTGGTGGQINLTITIKQIGLPSIIQWAVINYNANATEFLAALLKFDAFATYQPSVVLTTYDVNGAVTTDPTKAITYLWRVNVPLSRTSTSIKQVIVPAYLNYIGTKYFTQIIVHSHGPLISGSFGVKVGGVILTSSGTNFIRYNAGASQLQAAFRAVAGLQNVQVILLSNSALAGYGSSWLISYYGYNYPLSPLQLDSTNLNGGISSSKPTVSFTQIRPFRPTLLVDPIDFNFLNTPSSKINVLVTVNNVSSVCTGDCSYSFLTDTPMLSSANISNSILTLSLTDPSALNFVLSDVTVTLNGQICPITAGFTSISNFQCQLPINSDSTPTMTSGSFLPVVTVKQVGQVSVNTSITAFDFPLSLTSLNSTSGPSNGGYEILLKGTGFPLDISKAYVTICGKNATIETINNIVAKILVPSCNILGLHDIFISDGTQISNSLSFNYVTSTPPAFIFSITPQSFNPSLKGVMQIFGSGFGTQSSAVRVDLSNSSGKVYQMRILQINDTYIKTGIPGGLPGNFKVEVNILGVGEAVPNTTNANSFTYELVIQSITPSSGSYNGGTLINIKGRNFSPALDQTLVFVGNELNWMCTVQKLNTTDIFCRTPPFNEYYNISKPQTVVLTNRLMVDNTCDVGSDCSFTYNIQASSPQLSSMSTNIINTGTITLTGTNLNIGTPQVILTNLDTNLVSIVVPSTSSATSLTFTVPKVQSGSYRVKVRNDPIGESNGYLLNITATLTSASPSILSINGATVVLTGNGFPTTWPNSLFTLKILANNKPESFVQPVAMNISSTSFSIDLPASANGTKFYIYLTTPLGTILATSVYSDNQYTPSIAIATSSPSVAGLINFNFTQSNLQSAVPTKVEIYSLYNSDEFYSVTGSSHITGSIAFTYTLTGGKYGFRFYFASYGWAVCSSTVSLTTTAPTIPAISSSYNGGVVDLSGSGISKSGTIKVNGFKTRLQKVTSTGAEVVIPPFASVLTQQRYNLVQPSNLRADQFIIISDTPSNQKLAFDGVQGTLYSSTSTSVCYVGVDVGSDLILSLNRIRFFPNSRWMIVSNYLVGSRFQGSQDGSSWTNIGNVDSTVHSGWNILSLNVPVNYRQFRFVHDTTSNCQLAEIQFQGILLSKSNPTSLGSNPATVTYEDGANSFILSNTIEFREDNTPIINSLSQTNGNVFGNYTLSLYGANLNFATPTVMIDGIPCIVSHFNLTQIDCVVGSRLTLPPFNSFVVKVGNTNVLTLQTFSYVLRWSDIRTWGTDLFPVDGDLVFVPAGMNLLVDQSTPILKGILVQNGTLTFADESNMIISAGIITVVGGKLIAGTQQHPYQHKLTFVMYGDYYGPQQPMFGNKGIGCMECFISIYGQVRQYTWTSLQTTVLKGSNTLTVQDPVDWRVGEQIAIASTSHDHWESQDRIITAINGKTITVDLPFSYQHFAGIQTYSSTDQLQMRAEVGLLTRNIKMMGEPNSAKARYGSHLMMTGSAENGFKGHIAYTEFTDCGQPKIIGRYCIHFHMNGDLSDSFALGNAVHHSMARVVTLHGAHFLTVKDNVGYRVQGHNYFVEDGIETNNLIEHNLAITSIQAWTMLQTDISVASFWITHPSNHFRFNHAAGGDFYGFWYEIKPRPDGPSACTDVCPMGNALGESRNNVAHSNKRFGLRIFKLSPRTYPCGQIYAVDQLDPWKYNPGVIGVFSNYTLYKNGEAGLLAQETGNLVFINITSAQNLHAGAEFYVVEFTKDLTSFKNSVIIGQTKTNSPASITGAKGIITPRLGNIRIDNIRFYNFPSGTHSLQTCSKCDQPLLFTNTAQEIFISNITYTNVSGYKLFMNGLKRQIIYDLDGTFTTNAFDGKQRKSAAVVTNYKHLVSDPACLPTSDQQVWDSTIACDESVKLARVTFNNVLSQSIFNLVGLKAQQISSINDTVPEDSTSFTQIYSFFSLSNKMDAMRSAKKTYAMPYITGRIYNIWWLTGLDFDHLTMSSSRTLNSTDAAIRFKFNYTLNRQLYEVAPVRPSMPLSSNNLFVRGNTQLDDQTCQNGQYYHDNTAGSRTLELCASGKNKTYFETTDVNAVYCRYLCPIPPGEFVKEDFVRYWSNASQWPNGKLPKDGDNVTVNGNWTIIMDIDPARCQFMQIDGDVIIEDKADRNIQCDTIWIRAGSLKAGSASVPFTHKINIQLNGLKNSPGYTFSDTLVGSKIFVVTGILSLYGQSPATVSAKLLATALKGSSTISVESTAGWQIGDQIVISPTFSSSREYERVTITTISGNTVTFTPVLAFTHYGAADLTINNSFGTLDTRATVGHVTRNIKFISGPDSGWGYTIVVNQMWENAGAKKRVGLAILNSVQFTLGGQYDTEKASLVLNNNWDGSSGTTIVSRSSFSFCRSFCIFADTHSMADISDNVFYQARKFHIKAKEVSHFKFNRNTMMGAIIRPTMIGKEPVACIQLTEVDPIAYNLQFTSNICQGSDVNGFVFPFVPCSSIASIPYSLNTAGSSEVGFLFIGSGNGDCLAFSGAKAYGCHVGQICSPPNTKAIQFSNFIMADNQRGVTLRFGLQGQDRSAFLKDSYITQISRPTCAECYGAGKIDCAGNQALRMLVTTVNGQNYPTAFDSKFDGICKQQTFDSKSFLTNVQFDYFKLSYSQPALSQCSNNIVFKSHSSASDLSGSAYTWNNKCTNCEFNALASFDPPKLSELTWFGGCGNMTCTGKNNYIIQDNTATLFPNVGVLIANNSWVGDGTSQCTYNPTINGHYCTRSDIGVLEYESIAPDFNTRIMWPVSLNPEGGNWTSLTNGYKEWQWSGNQPLNKRLGRFISVVQLNQRYNMTFASNPPDDMRLQIQKRTETGNSSDWVIVKLYYPFPNSIQVQANGAVVKPISLLDNSGENPLDTAVCGSNKFFYKNYTIHFVITGVNCMVRVTLTNSVQLTLRFSMNINDFYSANGPTRLIDRMCAILQITDQSKVKIVGIYTGSTIIVMSINDNTTLANESTLLTPQQQAKSLSKIQTTAAVINQFFTNGSLQKQIGLGVILSASSVVLPVHPVSQTPQESDNQTVIIAVVVSIVGLMAIVGGIILYLKKQSNNKVAEEIPAFSSSSEGQKGQVAPAREMIEVQNITQENISEVIFQQKH